MSTQERYFLETLKLTNYRCFPELNLNFDSQLTILVAPNGGGKTAVLDGAVAALRLFVDTMEGRGGNSKGFDSKDIRLILNPAGMMEQITPVRLEASGHFIEKRITWARERQSEKASRTTTVEAYDLKRSASLLLKEESEWLNKKKPTAPFFPLISYYGTGRLWSAIKLTEGKKTKIAARNARHRGYTDCLSSSSHYKYFIDWFHRFSLEGKKESPGHLPSPHEPHRILSAVAKAVDIALKPSGWQTLTWDFAEDVIVAYHPEYGRLPVDTLSDGIRNMIGLVADMAHRAARLNPHLKENAARETPGIVFIDEVDMHLHPEWQQIVVKSLQEAFPLVQFIVTTHSPQVLTTVRKENIRILEVDENGDWTARTPEISPLAHESGDALACIMDTRPRPIISNISSYIHEYESLAHSGKLDSEEARIIKKNLDEAGFEFNDAEQALLAFMNKKKTPTKPDDR